MNKNTLYNSHMNKNTLYKSSIYPCSQVNYMILKHDTEGALLILEYRVNFIITQT